MMICRRWTSWPILSLPSPKDAPNEFPSSQRSLWQKLRERHHLPWRITDLVTLGSPLAHADVLLAESEVAFQEGKRQREFPTAPARGRNPRDHGLLGRTYEDDEAAHYVHILHHGAPFAVTRWTNLYFPGDIIGGPVARLFGGRESRTWSFALPPADGWMALFRRVRILATGIRWRGTHPKNSKKRFTSMNSMKSKRLNGPGANRLWNGPPVPCWQFDSSRWIPRRRSWWSGF